MYSFLSLSQLLSLMFHLKAEGSRTEISDSCDLSTDCFGENTSSSLFQSRDL